MGDQFFFLNTTTVFIALKQSEVKEERPSIILEMNSIILTSVRKGCEKEISLLFQLMLPKEFDGDRFRKWFHSTENFQDIHIS